MDRGVVLAKDISKAVASTCEISLSVVAFRSKMRSTCSSYSISEALGRSNSAPIAPRWWSSPHIRISCAKGYPTPSHQGWKR